MKRSIRITIEYFRKKFTLIIDFSVSDNFFIIKLPNLNYGDPINDSINLIKDDVLNDIDLSILRTIQLNSDLNAKQTSENHFRKRKKYSTGDSNGKNR